MILKLRMKHQAMELYKVCINHDPGMTLTFLRQGQLRSPMHLNGEKIGKCHLNGRKLARNEQMDRRFMFMKIFWAQVVAPGLYTFILLKYSNILSETAWPIKAKLYVEHP